MATSKFYEEACELVPACLEIRARLHEEERTFVDGMAEKLAQYKERSYISEKQINWLRGIAKKAPDPRQANLF
ncbi:MAG: hypothetical protein U0Y68_18340 [Blastocatellia bacterium]